MSTPTAQKSSKRGFPILLLILTRFTQYIMIGKIKYKYFTKISYSKRNFATFLKHDLDHVFTVFSIFCLSGLKNFGLYGADITETSEKIGRSSSSSSKHPVAVLIR
jgi:hypothetical protein